MYNQQNWLNNLDIAYLYKKDIFILKKKIYVFFIKDFNNTFGHQGQCSFELTVEFLLF